MAEPTVLRRLRAALGPAADALTDAELLARFAADRDSGAFELLVWRHADIVLRVCRGVLRDRQAAEDAAQAVFLALARQAAQVGRRGSAAGWLFRVARRVAARAARRRARDRSVTGTDLDLFPSAVPAADPDRDRVIHDELARLPEAYRVVVLVCFFEGLTHTQAADRLGWPVGTVAGRLARAKDRLARRLSGRGVGLAAVVPVVGDQFVGATAAAAVAYTGHTVPAVSAGVLKLADSEVRMTTVTKVFRAVAVLTASAGVLALGLAGAMGRLPQSDPSRPAPVPAAAKPLKPVVEKTFAVAPVVTDLQRRLIIRADRSSAVIVFVDGIGLFRDQNTLDLDALNLKGIRTTLAEHGPTPDRTVHFLIGYRQAAPDVHRTGSDLLRYGMEGLGRDAGFGRASAMVHYGMLAWDDWMAPLRGGAADGSETAVGDDRVRAYPVRTAVSRVLAGSNDAVVDVRTQLDPRKDDWVPVGLNDAVRAAISDLKLAKGKKVLFLIAVPNRDENTPAKVKELTERWASDAGVEAAGFTY